MTDPNAFGPPGHDDIPAGPNLFGSGQSRQGRLARRRQKIADEIDRNRRGDYKVPTWVLATCLVVFVLAWAAWIIFS